MVVKMMRWPPWPPLSSRKFEVKVIIYKVKGLNFTSQSDTDNDDHHHHDMSKKRLVVEIKWKGQKSNFMRRSVKRSFTEEGGFCGDGVFEWNEEFNTVCSFSGYKEGVFFPWEVSFTVFNGLNQGPRNKVFAVGTGTINLAEFASTADEKEFEIEVPLILHIDNVQGCPSLCLSLKLFELRSVQETPQTVQISADPLLMSPPIEALSPPKDEVFGLKAGLRRVKIFQGTKKSCLDEDSSDGGRCITSKAADYNYPFDTDSLDDDAEGESDKSNGDSSSQLSINYETLTYANISGGLFYSNAIIDPQDEGWIYYNNHIPDFVSVNAEYSTASVSEAEQSLKQSSKRRILPWRTRQLGFRSSNFRAKGEPLLKKDYGEEGGDDIDFDRRQLSSSDESSLGWNKTDDSSMTSRSSISEFGEDYFAVGSWEQKEVISRDGHMKLQAQVFFASIDQRSGRAAGESACTALVAVIANWLQSNRYEVPIKSEFDSLIRDGSLEWRRLCENEDYRQRFPDKHFDLETVLEAKMRPLSVVPEKSFIGFFHPEGLEGEDFDFLHGAMSFDGIWEEISRYQLDWPNNGDPLVYIVSWNDHFFVLKVEQDAYYIIDTLGERLYEGCNQAYVLKFDRDATIQQLPSKNAKASDEKSAQDKAQPSISKDNSSAKGTNASSTDDAAVQGDMEGEIVSKGKDSCKEYIKNFLAAVPLRELQSDIKRGLMASTPLHHRLQIEFHYTRSTLPVAGYSTREASHC